jgi:hypothetical protein
MIFAAGERQTLERRIQRRNPYRICTRPLLQASSNPSIFCAMQHPVIMPRLSASFQNRVNSQSKGNHQPSDVMRGGLISTRIPGEGTPSGE